MYKAKYYAKPLDKVHIKTLEEIRQEKALRQKHATKTQNEETVTQHQVPINHKRVVLNSEPRGKSETKPDKAPTEQNSSYSQVSVRTSVQDYFKLPAVPPVSVAHKFLPEKKQERMTPAVQNVMKAESDIKVYHAANLEVPEARAPKRTGGSTVYIQKKKMKGDPKGNTEPGAVNNSTPTKNAFKRKSQETLAVFDRPLVSAVSSTVNVHISDASSRLPALHCLLHLTRIANDYQQSPSLHALDSVH
ncbi:uncharacterized protein O3C94_001757 [Discoglossus pictus]